MLLKLLLIMKSNSPLLLLHWLDIGIHLNMYGIHLCPAQSLKDSRMFSSDLLHSAVDLLLGLATAHLALLDQLLLPLVGDAVHLVLQPAVRLDVDDPQGPAVPQPEQRLRVPVHHVHHRLYVPSTAGNYASFGPAKDG